MALQLTAIFVNYKCVYQAISFSTNQLIQSIKCQEILKNCLLLLILYQSGHFLLLNYCEIKRYIKKILKTKFEPKVPQ